MPIKKAQNIGNVYASPYNSKDVIPVTLVHPYKHQTVAYNPFLNDVNGINMNVNGGTLVSYHNIYDENVGTPTEADTSAIIGTWSFDSTNYANSGTKAINGTATINGDIMQLTHDSLFVVSSSEYFVGSIYITKWNAVGTKHIYLYFYNTVTGLTVGNVINIDSYVNTAITNTWQQFLIPITDLGIQDNEADAIRIAVYNTNPNSEPDFYLDSMFFNDVTASSQVDYYVYPPDNTILHIDSISSFWADAYSPVLTGSTMPKLPYNAFLGVPSLTNGILITIRSHGNIVFGLPIKNLGDILAYLNTCIDCYGSDGTNTWMKIVANYKNATINLYSSTDDYIKISIRDDLRGLLRLNMNINGSREVEA